MKTKYYFIILILLLFVIAMCTKPNPNESNIESKSAVTEEKQKSEEKEQKTKKEQNSETVEDCTACDGSGICSQCNGDRYWYSGEFKFPCYLCHGTGKCDFCEGTGKHKEIIISNTPDIIPTPSGSSSSSSEVSSSSFETSSPQKTKLCSNCNGTGRYHHPAQGKVPRFNGERSYITCDNCGATNVDLEYHDCKCRKCDGEGFVYE